MKKIPSLFERDWNGDRSRVLEGPPKVDLTGAVATRKWDGTAVLIRDGKLFKRYDAKPGRTPPPGFELVQADEVTGHNVGWVPVGEGPEDCYFREATQLSIPPDGTYELVGPKVNGNADGLDSHFLVKHGEMTFNEAPTDFNGIREFLSALSVEGLVWWKDGEPIAKIKRRDFGLEWPVKKGEGA